MHIEGPEFIHCYHRSNNSNIDTNTTTTITPNNNSNGQQPEKERESELSESSVRWRNLALYASSFSRLWNASWS